MESVATAEALFGAELRARRVAAGYSLRALAPRAHISHDLLARIEKAQRRPQPDVVERLDTALNAHGRLVSLAAAFTVSVPRPSNRIVLDPESAEFILREVISNVRAADHTMAAEHLDDIVTHTCAASKVLQIGRAHV